MRAGGELTMFIRISINRVVEKISSDPAVIQKGIPFSWRSVAADPLRFTFSSDQEFQQFSLCFLHLLGKRSIRLHTSQSCGFFSYVEFFDAIGQGPRFIFCVPYIYP